MSHRLSSRTVAWIVAGVIAVIVIAALISAGIGGEQGTLAIADFGETILVAASAAVVLAVALSFPKGDAWRLNWVLIALGMVAFAIGDAVWTYQEVIQGIEPPYPGLPDVFYLLEYPLIAFGLLRAGVSYRGLVDVRRPAWMAVAVGVVGTVVMWFGLLAPSVVTPDVPPLEAAVSAAYPLADLWLLIAIALFVALVVSRLGRGLLAWPWWAVMFGVVLLAIADSGYAWLQAYDAYTSGSPIDYGWSLGHVLLAAGALIAYDIAHPRAAR